MVRVSFTDSLWNFLLKLHHDQREKKEKCCYSIIHNIIRHTSKCSQCLFSCKTCSGRNRGTGSSQLTVTTERTGGRQEINLFWERRKEWDDDDDDDKIAENEKSSVFSLRKSSSDGRRSERQGNLWSGSQNMLLHHDLKRSCCQASFLSFSRLELDSPFMSRWITSWLPLRERSRCTSGRRRWWWWR